MKTKQFILLCCLIIGISYGTHGAAPIDETHTDSIPSIGSICVK